MYILAAIIVLSPLNTLFGSVYYRPKNKIWIQSGIIVFASAINISVSYFLISSFQSLGASAGRFIAEIVQLPLLMFFSRKSLSKSTIFHSFIKPFDNSLIMFLVVFACDAVLGSLEMLSPIVMLCLEILIGIIVYGIMEILTKETFGYGLMSTSIRRIKKIIKH